MKNFSLKLFGFVALSILVVVAAQPDVLSPDVLSPDGLLPDKHYQTMQEHHKEVFTHIVNSVPNEVKGVAEDLQTRRQELDAKLEALHVKAVEIKQQAIEQGEPKNVAKALAKQATADEQVELARQSAAFKEDMHAFIENYPEIVEAVMAMHEKHMQDSGYKGSDMHAYMFGKGYGKNSSHQGMMQGKDKGMHQSKPHQGMTQGQGMYQDKPHQSMMQGQTGQAQKNSAGQSRQRALSQRELIQGMSKLNNQQIQAIFKGSSAHMKAANVEKSRSWDSEGNLDITVIKNSQEEQLSGKWSVNEGGVYCEAWLTSSGSRSNHCYHIYGKVGQLVFISNSDPNKNEVLTLETATP